ncbi:hypothetical protein GSY69_03875 [Brevibacterium sp. 5221]|uniref:Uncharacterized protein n=1 Tax=Brevibacterium rongguiense TaxID=2695267 RepID=A0A6N9H5L1_9MICO|nr:hypothetical protein [Brevibacterium rongguiense]MYM19131.1 hypothetical protein [Brevibacterium rongguiense]
MRDESLDCVVILNMQELRDRAIFEEPTCAPKGVEEVLVNGVRAVAAGQWTGRRAGEFVRAAH